MDDDYSRVAVQHEAFLAEEKGEVAGVLVLIRQDSGMLLDNVAVHPDFQGEGLGRRLIEFAETESRNQGYAHLELYTHERMTENLEMYNALGYVETARRIEDGYQRVYMRKALS